MQLFWWAKQVLNWESVRLAKRGVPRAHKALALRKRRSAFAFRQSLPVFKSLLPERLKIRPLLHHDDES
jgi:hypothetical protein